MTKAQSEKKKFNGTRWTPAEQRRLMELRDDEKVSFEVIATKLSRKVNAVERRYEKLKEEQSLPSDFIWNTERDNQITTGRQKGTTIRELALAMNIPPGVVQDRVTVLRKEGKMPADAAGKGKGKQAEWTDEDDEVLLRMYIAMADEAEIHKTAGLVRKTLSSIKHRRQLHLRGESMSPNASQMYRKLLMEFSDPRKRWSKQDIIDRKFVMGSWKDMAAPVEKP
ncbi:hypothetical protein K458DRAFT_387596 [Lentithecium fluviatile CBS 122367]|uniref:Myb-like domain-containing protein n=1 Tax=Lentithecium fluviatile CBS 122367 TaxID=1168545 RepID=A0A6G1J520_9PLEO|nr:hypothetical protein K458DRAFT_387596 [Lentithecium fluviatile CBS 122367]